MASSALERTRTGARRARPFEQHPYVKPILKMLRFAQLTQSAEKSLEAHLRASDSLGRSTAKYSTVRDVAGRARRRTSDAPRKPLARRTDYRFRAEMKRLDWIDEPLRIRAGERLPNGGTSSKGQEVLRLKLGKMLADLSELQKQAKRRRKHVDELAWFDPRTLTEDCAPPAEPPPAEEEETEPEEEENAPPDHDEQGDLNVPSLLSVLPERENEKIAPFGASASAPATPANAASETPPEAKPRAQSAPMRVAREAFGALATDRVQAQAPRSEPPERAPREGEHEPGRAARQGFPAYYTAEERAEAARFAEQVRAYPSICDMLKKQAADDEERERRRRAELFAAGEARRREQLRAAEAAEKAWSLETKNRRDPA